MRHLSCSCRNSNKKISMFRLLLRMYMTFFHFVYVWSRWQPKYIWFDLIELIHRKNQKHSAPPEEKHNQLKIIKNELNALIAVKSAAKERISTKKKMKICTRCATTHRTILNRVFLPWTVFAQMRAHFDSIEALVWITINNKIFVLLAGLFCILAIYANSIVAFACRAPFV